MVYNLIFLKRSLVSIYVSQYFLKLRVRLGFNLCFNDNFRKDVDYDNIKSQEKK